MLLTALAIDIMLPAFGAVRHYFGLMPTSTETARIVTFFFFGQLGQIVFGVLADRYGRIPVLRLGFLLYISGCVATVFTPGLFGLLIARFITGLGASALFVGAVACVRDRFSGNDMARTMSFILTIFLIVPIIAPLMGSAILAIAGWKMVFLTPALFAILFFIWSLRLQESLPPETRSVLNLRSLVRSIKQIWRNRVFARYTIATTILFAAFSSYIGSSERLISTIYGQPSLFVSIFGAVGLLMAIFTFLNAQFVARWGARTTVRGLLFGYVLVAGLLLLLTLLGKGHPNIFIFFALVALLQSLNVAAEPNSSSLALEPMGPMAGLAASIYGTSYLVVGALAGSFIDRLLVDSVTPLATAYLIGSFLSFLLVITERADRYT